MRLERLTCLTFDYPPMKGGVARYLSELAKVSGGQMSVVVPLEHPKDVKYAKDVTCVRFWWSGWPKWLPLIKRCLEIKEGMILVSHVVPVGTAAWIAYAFGGPPYIVLFHGTDLQRMKTRWKRWLLRRICGNATKLVVNSLATAKALKALVPGAEPLVLTPGVDLGRHAEPVSASHEAQKEEILKQVQDDEGIQDDRKGARRALKVDEKAKVVLTVCRLIERKGTDTLIQAVNKLQDAYPDIRLVVVGSGPYAQPLHQLAELMNVPVTWVEGASDEQVSQWYAAADIFCLPAREEPDDVEGFGIVLLEAAASGLPVVAGSGWGTQEAVQDGVTGLLVQPSVEPVTEALRKLIDDSVLRRKLGQAGQERAKRDFKWEDRWIQLRDSLSSPVIPGLTRNPEKKSDGFPTSALGLLGNDKVEGDIAVVIPCYDHAAELEKTLQALAEQTLQPKEVVVVDDCSGDDPKAVVEKYHDRLNISYHRLPTNQGAPAARNTGSDLTTAPYIIFLDADAELEPQALDVLRRTLTKHPEAAFAYSNFYWGKKLFRGKPWDAEALRKLNWIHTSSLLRRSAFPRFDEDLKKFQDWDLWLTMAEQGGSGIWVDEALFRVTERKTGISRWLPSFVHKLPWPILGWMPLEIKRYREAESIIRKKHSDGSPTSALNLLGDDENV
jgi:glycosyltransferase involved in cell wall biosynthesis